MQIDVARSLSPHAAEATIVFYFDDTSVDEIERSSGITRRVVEGLIERKELRPRESTVVLVHGDGSAPSTCFVGAGSRADADLYRVGTAAGAAGRYLSGKGFCRIAVVDPGVGAPGELARAVTDGIMRGAYDPGLMKTSSDGRRPITSLIVVSDRDEEDLRHGLEIGNCTGESREMTRNLVNLPPNELTPRILAERSQDMAEKHGLSCEVLDRDGMAELGMGSLLGVARGSTEPSFLIALGYGPTDAGIRLALVGKGLTFDSGGLSLKTANGMEAMKGDMGGAAAVIGGMMAISRLAPAGIHVMGLVGATENMPSGTAMRPGDVLTAMNGKTIEVLNTDAEGRLVLADLLTFAEKQGATHIVDFATLTGSAIAALGTTVTLATGKPEDWVETVVNAARCGSERAWPMPLYPEYRRAMDSDVADIKNVSSGRAAGALTASAFLSEFVDSVPWAHMDIAGPSWNSESRPHLAKGGTGAGVGTIVSLVLEMSEGQ